jgi:hypothetical protein
MTCLDLEARHVVRLHGVVGSLELQGPMGSMSTTPLTFAYARGESRICFPSACEHSREAMLATVPVAR